MENASRAKKIGVSVAIATVLAASVWAYYGSGKAPVGTYEVVTESGTVIGSGNVDVANGEVVAYLNRSEGEVAKDGGSASAGDSVRVGETVSVGEDSSAEIIFTDSSVVRLAENTALAVKSATASSTELELLSGEIWARVLKPLSEGSFFSITSSDLSAGVRGTSLRMARNGNESELEVFDSTGNGAETPGVDVTFLDKDGIETRERIEPENGIGFDAGNRKLKKKKFSVADAMKRSFVRENTVQDIAYMKRLADMAEDKSGSGLTDPIISEIEGRLDKKSLREIRERLAKEIASTLPKKDEMPAFFSDPTLRERALSETASGDTDHVRSVLLREAEREAFLLFQDRKISNVRREAANRPSDSELRSNITKKVGELREERQKRIEEWRKAPEPQTPETPTTGTGTEERNQQSTGAVLPEPPKETASTAPKTIPTTPPPAPVATPVPKDSDGDEVPDFEDNCPGKPNPGQRDTDGDGLGDLCDATPFGAKKPAVSSEPVVR